MKYVFLLFCFFTFADESQTQVESELEGVNFGALEEILEKDKLSTHVKKKLKAVKKVQELREKEMEEKKYYPSSQDFLPFLTQMWLVKNAAILKWDFEKPEYGIAQHLSEVLRKVGLIKRQYKILIINTDLLPSFALPTEKGSGYLLLSLPFMKTLDLSKNEISLLLLQDILRMDGAYLEKTLKETGLFEKVGKKMTEDEPNVSFVSDLLAHYSKNVFEVGVNFQQQFEVTKQMDNLLKGHENLRKSYLSLLNKISEMDTQSDLFKNYNKLFPTAKMQLEWLQPSRSKSFP